MDTKMTDEFLLAVVSAYVWVASADEGVDINEMHKYEHVIIESPFATQFNEKNIREYFKDMVTMFSDDFDAAMALTKSRLEKFRTKESMAEEILRVSRSAIVGDAQLKEPEENAYLEIQKVLGKA